MQERYLRNNETEQTTMLHKIKYLADEILTRAIEVMMGHPITEWTEDEKERVKEYTQFPDQKLCTKRRDGVYVIEHTSAVNVLMRLIDEERRLWSQDIKDAYTRQTKHEKDILREMRETRNNVYGHAVDIANMGDLYLWLTWIERYIDRFIAFRLNSLSSVDERYGKQTDIDLFNEYKTRIDELKSKCFATETSSGHDDHDNRDNDVNNHDNNISIAHIDDIDDTPIDNNNNNDSAALTGADPEDDISALRFCGETYRLSPGQNESLTLLTMSMCTHWQEGIKELKGGSLPASLRQYLIQSRTHDHQDTKEDILGNAKTNTQENELETLASFDEHTRKLSTSVDESPEESVYYLSFLFFLTPSLPRLYWSGTPYTLEGFAEKYIAPLISYPVNISLKEKADILYEKLYGKSHEKPHEKPYEKQDSTVRSDSPDTGITPPIPIFLLLKENILETFTDHAAPHKVSEIHKLREIILQCEDRDYLYSHYDEIITSLLSFVTCILGTYRYEFIIRQRDRDLPHAPFDTPDMFRKFFIGFMKSTDDIDRIAYFAHALNDDVRFRFFMDDRNSHQQQPEDNGNGGDPL